MQQLPLCSNLSADGNTLYFAGQDTAALAARYGTPLYLMDEDRIRERCGTYLRAVKTAFGDKGYVLYASKAAAFKRMYEIMAEEGLCVDVVSPGEIATAAAAGFPLERAWFHSNNKSDEDICFALDKGVGCFVIDSEEELLALDRLAGARGERQPILLRLTPGIDTHTFEAVATGKVDSKFGFGIETGVAEAVTRLALSLHNVRLAGFHCHVGSQLFDADVYLRSADIMLDFIARAKALFGYEPEQLNLGGGYGVRYLESDPVLDLEASILEIGAHVKRRCAELGLRLPAVGLEPGRSIVADAGLTLYTVGMVKRIPGYVNYVSVDGGMTDNEIGAHVKRRCAELGLRLPAVGLEPGRSIVADAGLTLYTVGMVKRIPGYVNYVSVDGGMTDNPRYALYGAPYTVYAANRMDEPCALRCSVVGRCCESGDVIQPGVLLPESIRRGDLVAVCTTGAYHYSMASNYNRVPRPPVVMLRGGESYVAVRRESLDDLLRLDI